MLAGILRARFQLSSEMQDIEGQIPIVFKNSRAAPKPYQSDFPSKLTGSVACACALARGDNQRRVQGSNAAPVPGGLKLQPLRFMELSLQNPMRCIFLSRSGPVVVNLPRSERYALHKLLVFGERVQAQRVKAMKDLVQSAALVDYLLQYDVAALAQIWPDIQARGPGWCQRMAHGFKALETSYSSLHFEDRMRRLLAQ